MTEQMDRIQTGYHTGYPIKYLNSIELKQDTTGYHNFFKNIYIHIFLKKLWYPVVSCLISLKCKYFIWYPVWYPDGILLQNLLVKKKLKDKCCKKTDNRWRQT